jgi:hypothetical protein
MPTYFGPFDKFWQHSSPLHVHIMNLRPSDDGSVSPSDRAVEMLNAIVHQGPKEEVRNEIANMLNDKNWRSNIVGALCIFLLPAKEHAPLLELAWKRLEERSWACPQLVATVSVLDKDFRQKAVDLLDKLSASTLPVEKYAGSLYQALLEKYGASGARAPAEKGEVSTGKEITSKWLKGLAHYFPGCEFRAGSR